MKISTKGKYGLKAMIDIAANSITEETITLKTISERQNISERYLEQIIASLRKAELVKSIKGPQGGYILGDSMENISVGKILRAVEGNLHVVEKEQIDFKDKLEKTVYNEVWEKLNTAIDDIIDKITLEYVVAQYRKNLTDTFMYYI